jgi:hypothetical protein
MKIPRLGWASETLAINTIVTSTVATKVKVGDGRRALFWESSWLEGKRPKDIAPLIYDISKKKNCLVSKAMSNDFWVSQINTQIRWPLC